MITLKNLHLYKKYVGDADVFARSASAREKAVSTGRKWSGIDQLLQDLVIVRRDLASDGFVCALKQRINLLCDSRETIEELEMISVMLSPGPR